MDSEWLRDAVRFSQKATVFTSSIDNGLGPGPPDERDPRFRKLVEGILHSRRLILTYHLVFIGVVLSLSAVHWTGKVVRWRKRRISSLQLLLVEDTYGGDAIKTISPQRLDTDGSLDTLSSSGSSTLGGTASLPRDIRGEDTPLLHHSGVHRFPRPRRSIISSIKAFLMYQPRPIPFFNKILPSNGTSIMIAAFVSLNIFYTFFHINFNKLELFVLADRFGLIFAANLPLLYILAAKNQPLKALTGRSYESLNIFHRRLGEILCLEAFLHGLGMLGVWYTLLRRGGFTFEQFLFNRVILLGLGALLSYELLYLTSLASFRQLWYELFLGFHVVLQTAALAFLFFHHAGSRIYVSLALAIFVVDRLAYRIGVKSVTVEASATVMGDEETVKLSTSIIKTPRGILSYITGSSVKDGWQATDHVFVTIPSLGRKHMLQAHPFTIASAAPASEFNETRLNLLIRAQYGLSLDLLNKARHVQHFDNCNNITLRLDGPYGSSYARHLLAASDLALVVAGGSGIAVAWPLIRYLLDISRSTDTEIAPVSVLKRQKIVLIWVVHKFTHIEWLGRKNLEEAENEGVEIVIPRATEEVGRPDLREWMSGVVDEWSKGKGGQRRKIGVVASGPDGLGRVVRNTCASLVSEGRDVDVTIEKFGW